MSPARVITAVTAALLAVVAAATPASASTAPEAWPVDEEALSTMEWIGVFIGGTALLFVAIWLIAAAVNAKSQHHVPVIPPETPEKGDHDIEATHRMPLTAAEDPAKH